MKKIRFPDGSEALIIMEDERTGAKLLDRKPDKNQLMWLSLGKYEVVDEFTLEELEKRLEEKEIQKERKEENSE
ncbi:hypothetical protein DRP07_09525 [Archaeoglobales archaeon]|nr:MAG: hypothetical protein DRP07_09525 [Archaeoglobales archaeon]